MSVVCQFEKIKLEWMEFLASQENVSEDVRAEMEKFRVLRLDEQYKADHQRHCPHCGLLAQWTDGCNQMTCGRDAADKGGKVHSQLGCGKNFNWDTARRYKARFQQFKASAGEAAAELCGSSQAIVRLTGVTLPARLCRMCFHTVREGTCFEELSSQAQRIGDDPLALLECVVAEGACCRSSILGLQILISIRVGRKCCCEGMFSSKCRKCAKHSPPLFLKKDRQQMHEHLQFSC